MYTIVKLVRKLLKIVNGNAAPWQVFLGTAFGLLLGFLPLWPAPTEPAPLGLAILAAAIVLNCHFGSVLLFMGLGTLASLALRGPAAGLGEGFSGLAAASAEIPFLHASLWSHTGWLGLSLMGLALAPLGGLAMAWAAASFRKHLRPKLEQRRKLLLAGKVAGNGLVLRATCWFFDI